ncbi:MAG: PspC domain-containing protein [Bacteroidetes bacterium]|nr:PspC domain-containing protein [Bacteroidota bacterium]
MNKTIIININGIVFHIEEDAYEILKNYMTDVKRHFMNSADSLEITTDIENRIAEMFNELLARDNKQVIIEQDVNEVIGQMGTVADFERSEQDTEASFTDTYYNTGATRRLFRDPDDRLVAGVCAGIANYFDINPAWIRLAFTLIVLAGGAGLILYIILWAVVPKAVTRADRMAMKGEKQNLEGFRRNFEQEMAGMRQNLSNFHNEARPFVYKARDFAGDFFDHLGNFMRGAGKVILKLIGICILICCFGSLVFFIVGFITLLSIGHFEPFHDLPYDLLQHHHAGIIYTSAFLIAAIPLLSIIMLVFKGIFKVGDVSRSTGTTALVIWLCAIGVFVYHIVGIATEFRSSASYSETISLKPAKNNTYYLRMNDLKYFTAEDSARLDIKNLPSNMQITDDEDNDFDHYHQRISLSIEKSDVPQPVLVEQYHARGRDYDDALVNSRNIKYMFTQQDSLLKFDERFYARNNNNELWHDEDVSLTLKLPLNAKVIVDNSMERISGINLYDCNELNKREPDKVHDATFIMTDNGLQCKVDTLVTDTIIRKHLSGDTAKIKLK